jgi:hypothetical protein
MSQKDLAPRILFGFGLAFFAFLYGFAASHFELFPHAFLSRALDQGVQLRAEAQIDLHHQHPARHEFAGVGGQASDPEPGVLLVTSYWADDDWKPGLRVLDRSGEVLHRWNADPLRLFPESPHQDGLRGNFHLASNYVHGSWLFEDGDVLFNIEYLGLVRLDAQGDVVWRLDRRTHHSVSRNERGNFWVSASNWIDDPTTVFTRFPGLLAPVAEDVVLEVTPDGEVVREASVLDAVFQDPDLRRLIWTVGHTRTTDLLHLNDVEELPSAIAGSYPGLDAGDLLVSLRYLDLVFVFDPDTLAVKWWRNEPFVEQHDPDFLGGGAISVFDNNLDGSLNGAFLGGSRLWQIEVGSGQKRLLYPAGQPGERRFYTAMGGKAQRLPRGHWLLTEAQFGRIFEVDETGRTVWEWCQERHDDGKTVSEVLEGTFYPYSPERVRAWAQR